MYIECIVVESLVINKQDSVFGDGTKLLMYSRQQNPYNVLYFWKDMSIVHEVNILNL